MQKLRSKLVEAFYNWIKLRLPEAVFQTLAQSYQALLELVFQEIENNSDENMEHATSCVIELISLARKNEKFGAINDLVLSKINHLMQKVDQAVSERDEELAEQLTDIFVELGNGHLNQIIDRDLLTIP